MNGLSLNCNRSVLTTALMLCQLIVLVASATSGDDFATPPAYVNASEMRKDASLHAVDFYDASFGVAVGALGTIVSTDDGGLTWKIIESNTHAQLDDVTWIDSDRVVVIGGSYDPYTNLSRGVVLFSKDGGRRWWRAADQELPRLHDLYKKKDGTLIAVGDWSPVSLSRIFESIDGGQTWKPSPDGFEQDIFPKPDLSLKSLRDWIAATKLPFVVRGYCSTPKPPTVWAVGDHGIIISRVADQPWRVSRGKGARTAVLAIAGSVDRIAWPLLARETLEARNRVSLLISGHAQEPTSDSQSLGIDLVRQASANVGVTSVDWTTKPANLSDWISVHRPAVLFLDAQLPEEAIQELTQKGVELGVDRVVSWSAKKGGQITFHPNAVLPEIGMMASDVWSDALSFLSPHQLVPGPISLRVLYDESGGQMRGDSLAGEVALAHGQLLGSKAPKASRRRIQMTHARRNHSALVTQLISQSENASEFREGVTKLLDQTAKTDQLRLGWMVTRALSANRVSCKDPAGFQTQILSELAKRHTGTSLASLAKIRLEAIEHSEEWQHLRRSLPLWGGKEKQDAAVDVLAVSPFQVQPVVQASYPAPVIVPDFKPTHVSHQQDDAAPQIDLRWEFHPLRLMTEEAARLRGDDGKLQPAERTSANIRRLVETSRGDWANLMNLKSRTAIIANRAAEPPRLDGVQNDVCWRGALPTAGTRQRIRCAYDEEFVYFAITTKVKESSKAPRPTARIRDHDLSDVDRLQLLIDTDGDLLTAFELQLSADGRTFDAVDGHKQWQPTWYVSSKQQGQFLHTEIAMTRSDLSDLPIVAGQSWMIRSRTLAAGSEAVPDWMPDPALWRRIRFE